MVRFRRNNAKDPGASFNSARNLGNFSDTVIVTDETIGGRDRADVYKVTFLQRSYAAIAITGLQEDVDVDVFDNKRNRVGRLQESGIRREFSAGETPAGVYYIRVYPATSSTTSYKLTVLSISY